MYVCYDIIFFSAFLSFGVSIVVTLIPCLFFINLEFISKSISDLLSKTVELH